ncbi:MAG: response regulator [Agriterribacter sp.]
MALDKKVLIIDDDSRNIFALEAYLKSKKINCIVAGNAGDGIELLEADPLVAVVLMDVMMPDMDGYEAMTVIRKKEKFKSLPLIAVTAQAMVGDREKSLEAGATAYLSKPVNTDALMQLLEKYLK